MNDRLTEIIGDLNVAAHVRAHLMSAPMIERAAYAMYLDRPLELDQNGDDDWAILPDEWRLEWLDAACAAVEGLLAADGVVEPPTRQGGNET